MDIQPLLNVDRSKGAIIPYNRKQRTFIIDDYFATSSHAMVRNRPVNAFPDFPLPNKSTIKRFVDKFRQSNNIENLKPTPMKRVLCAEKGDEIRNNTRQEPSTSTHKMVFIALLGIDERLC